MEELYGRELLLSELPKKLRNSERLNQLEIQTEVSYMEKNKKKICRRCRNDFIAVRKGECLCNEACGYCRNCLKMGKVRLCSTFYSLREENAFQEKKEKLLAWAGTLSDQQKEASEMIIQTIQQNETRLLWAVTGAGKTEMLFEGIEYALKHQKRVCLASPRVDVCLELAPRIQAAFPTTDMILLYGGMEEEYHYTQLVVATTHQLYRFKEAFDVLIIDEIDAFPFHSDDALKFAANKARKEKAALIYLSATPSPSMQKDVKKNKIKSTILPARYHGYPLPEPRLMWCSKWESRILKKLLKTSFGKKVKEYIESGQKFLIFIPNIEWMLKLEKVIKKTFPDARFEAVSAEDSNRKEKVVLMREDKVQFLITSTILERGVTFKNVNVLVIGAEDRVFTEAALVQIAGRCGRSFKYPTGEVIYYHDGKSLAMKKAVKQIKRMNSLARKRGLVQ